jgi:hypothetical protein
MVKKSKVAARKKAAKSVSKINRRPDGRRATLLYIQPSLVLMVKKVALDRQTTAYLLVEQAIVEWLERQNHGQLSPS